jgi:putative DNA primase/helicase
MNEADHMAGNAAQTTGGGEASGIMVDLSWPLHRQVDSAWAAVAESNDGRYPEVMVRSGRLVRLNTEAGTLEEIAGASLRERVSKVARVGQTEATRDGGERWAPKSKPPPDLAETIMARDPGTWTGVPRVQRIVDVPVLAEDGRLIMEPGFHEGSGLYYRPAAGLGDLDLPEAVGVDDLAWAREVLLDELLVDFAFRDEGSRAGALAMLLTPFVRDYIQGPTPLFVVYARRPGWGKDELTAAVLSPACGRVATQAGAEDAAEWRKRITSALLTAPAAVVFDNLSGTIDVNELAKALTDDVWEDRELGRTRMVEVPVRNLWTMNGNNITMSKELAERSVPILLAPRDGATPEEMVTPRQRGRDAWRHADLKTWTRENRRELVRAALILVQNWLEGPVVQRDGPEIVREPELREPPERSMGSFENWAQVVGGILAAAEVGGFLSNVDELRDDLIVDDGEGGGAEQFLAAWERAAGEPYTAKELATLCRFGGPLHDYLPESLALEHDRDLPKKIGYWLKENKGVAHGGRAVVKAPKRDGVNRWEVRAVAAPA